MLVLNRNERGEIVLLVCEETIVISVLKIYKQPAKVRLGFAASENVVIRRREVHDAIERDKQA